MSYPHFSDPQETVEQCAVQCSYSLPSSYFPSRMDGRPDSSSSNMRLTSSLSGAVDEPHTTVQTQPGNPSSYPPKARSLHSSAAWNGQNDAVAWSTSYTPDSATPVYQRQSPDALSDSTYALPSVPGTTSSSYSSSPASSPTPSLFSSPFSSQTHFHPGRASQSVSVVPSSSSSDQSYDRAPRSSMEEELRALRKQKRDLELINERNHIRIHELERRLVRGNSTASTRHSEDPLIPASVQNTVNSSSMQMSAKARTEARIHVLCASNRAGNALCSWHDSRRERRIYPPRMAPPGYLNCGCTFEEALFEESLSRHGVGSYRPGETVRMDPALRRPLLRLLQQRYNYRDGDFERDPETGEWVQGEGHLYWERKLMTSSRKGRKEDRR